MSRLYNIFVELNLKDNICADVHFFDDIFFFQYTLRLILESLKNNISSKYTRIFFSQNDLPKLYFSIGKLVLVKMRDISIKF